MHEQITETLEKQLMNSLKYYSCGLFINPGSFNACPSLRVYSTDKIDFEQFDEWHSQYISYFDFLNIHPYACSRLRNSLLSYQDRSLFNNYMFKGISVLISEQHLTKPQNYNELGTIIRHFAYLFAEYLFPYYLLGYLIQIDISKYKISLIEIKDLKISENSASMSKIEENLIVIMKFASEITERSFEIDDTIEKILPYHSMTSLSPYVDTLNTKFGQFNILNDIETGIQKESDRLKELLRELKREIDYISKHNSDLSNFRVSISNLRLQKQIKIFTVITVITGVIATIFTIII